MVAKGFDTSRLHFTLFLIAQPCALFVTFMFWQLINEYSLVIYPLVIAAPFCLFEAPDPQGHGPVAVPHHLRPADLQHRQVPTLRQANHTGEASRWNGHLARPRATCSGHPRPTQLAPHGQRVNRGGLVGIPARGCCGKVVSPRRWRRPGGHQVWVSARARPGAGARSCWTRPGGRR